MGGDDDNRYDSARRSPELVERSSSPNDAMAERREACQLRHKQNARRLAGVGA
jgi:hypothetical protein